RRRAEDCQQLSAVPGRNVLGHFEAERQIKRREPARKGGRFRSRKSDDVERIDRDPAGSRTRQRSGRAVIATEIQSPIRASQSLEQQALPATDINDRSGRAISQNQRRQTGRLARLVKIPEGIVVRVAARFAVRAGMPRPPPPTESYGVAPAPVR